MTDTPPATIVCVECGGVCHLLSYLPEDDPLEEGSALSYRCEDCGDRWDLVWEPGS
jgi:DNA-directed RNA polymerase subunit M/transcription elongation factor TFIIS